MMKRSVILLGSILLLPACESLAPQPFKKKLIEDISTALEEEGGGKTLAQLSNEKNEQPRKKPKSEIFPASAPLVGSLTKEEKRYVASREGKFTLNFESAELSEVVKVILGDTLQVNYSISPKVVGKVSLQTSRPLSQEELLPTLELLLQANNAALIKDGAVYRIEPVASAVSSGNAAKLAFPGKKLPVGFQVRVIPLRYVSAKEMQDILKPMITPATLLRADSARNLLMLAGTETELENIQETVNVFDVNYMQGMSFGIFPFSNVDAATADKELAEIFGYTSGGAMEEMFKTVIIERLNALLVITPQIKYLEQIKIWIERLDRANTASAGGVNVYRAQHVKAVDLAATLSDIFMVSGGTQTAKPPSVAAGRSATQVSSKTTSGTAATTAPGGTQAAATKTSSTRSASFTAAGNARVGNVGDIRIIADEGNNSLIIVAAAQDYEIIRNVIKQLDVMPLQVHIDATILGVDLTDDLKYGVEWKFSTSIEGYQGLGTIGGLATAAAAAGTGGFSYVLSHANDVKAVISALDDHNNLTVLSSPSLMVLNNQEANIQVGDQIPIRTSQTSTIPTTTVTNPDQNINNTTFASSGIEMKDTGVKLKVTPRVNAGGMVLMDIEQSVDTARTTTTSGIDSPTILKRAITSSVAIASGETVLLGGLISEEDTDNNSGVPWFKDIPLFGPIFSTTERKKIRRELIVLITPTVVEDKIDARLVTDEYRRKLNGLYYSLPTANDTTSYQQ
ncbi:MAG: type II secretion system secretin GspD [Gammaproteobacteria bacterium]